MLETPPGEEPILIANFGKIEVYATMAPEPWRIPADALVIPTGPKLHHLGGGFARALANAVGEARWRDFESAVTALARENTEFGPSFPVVMESKPYWNEGGISQKYIILATAFENPTIPTKIGASAFSVANLSEKYFSDAVFPLLGAGDGDAEPEFAVIEFLFGLKRASQELASRLRIIVTTHSDQAMNHFSAIRRGLLELPHIKQGAITADIEHRADELAQRNRNQPGVRSPEMLFFALLSRAIADAWKPGPGAVLAEFQRSVRKFFKNDWSERYRLFLENNPPRPGAFQITVNEASKLWMSVAAEICAARGAATIGIEDFCRAIASPDLGPEFLGHPQSVWRAICDDAFGPMVAVPYPADIIASFQNDSVDGPDLLGVEPEARAFAELVALRSATPPLAVGLFGHWGTGKSFFMEKLCAFARERAEKARIAGDPLFCHRIVPIRFNAWHYIETNLWASLVDFIFQELDRYIKSEVYSRPDDLFEKLSTARRLKLEALEAMVICGTAKAEAEAALNKAEADYRQAQSRRPPMGDIAKAVAQRVAADPKVKGALAELSSKAGVPEFKERTASVVALAQEGWSLVGGIRLAGGALMRRFGWRWGLGLAVLGLALPFVPGWVAQASGAAWLGALATGMKGWIAAATALAAPVLPFAVKLVTVLAKLKPGLEALSADVEAATKVATEAEASALAAADSDASAKRLSVEHARRRYQEMAEALVSIERDMATQGAGGRLTRFIQDRVAEGEYSKHLTLVATIRKDLEQLSALMEAAGPGAQRQTERLERIQKERDRFVGQVRQMLAAGRSEAEPGSGRTRLPADVIAELEKVLREEEAVGSGRGRIIDEIPTFDRIVLFIDDLDRCPPDKVADVLQAVHMLLAFPLFVVVVAVDSRWVEEALRQRFFGLLKGGGNGAVTNGATGRAQAAKGVPLRPDDALWGGEGGLAEPRDYLEKIFQVPFWVEPMTVKVCGDYVGRLVTGILEAQAEKEDTPVGATGGRRSDDAAEPAGTADDWARDDADGGATGAEHGGTTAQASRTPADTDPTRNPASVSDAQSGAGSAPLSDPEPIQSEPTGTTTEPLRPEPLRLEPLRKVLAPLTSDDKDDLQAFAGLLGGVPRRAKRFVNLYQLVKTLVTGADLPEGIGKGERRVAVAMALLLAIVTGRAGNEDAVRRMLIRLGDPGTLVQPPEPELLLKDLGVVWATLKGHCDGIKLTLDPAFTTILVKLAPLIRRFSFDGPHDGEDAGAAKPAPTARRPRKTKDAPVMAAANAG